MVAISRTRDWALLLLCNLMWASQYVMVKVVQTQMGPLFATFFPVTLATVFLALVARREWRQKKRAGDPGRLPRRDLLDFALMGICGQIPAQLFITWGVRLSLASNAALLALALPVTTAVMAYFILGEKMTPVRWMSFALALAGVIECSGINWKDLDLTSHRFLLGNFLIFLAVVGSAFYNVYSKKLLRRYSPLTILFFSYCSVFPVMLPITLFTEPEGFRNLALFTPTVWLGLMELAIFAYFLSMIIFLNVLTRLDVTQAGLTNYLIPFFGLVLAALILHERLTKFMVLGGVLVLGSTLLITVYEERQRVRAGTSAVT